MEKPVLSNFKIIPEEIIIYCANEFGPGENNNFKESIDKAYQFRKVGLTPIYLCSENFNEVMVTSKERLNKQYN